MYFGVLHSVNLSFLCRLTIVKINKTTCVFIALCTRQYILWYCKFMPQVVELLPFQNNAHKEKLSSEEKSF